MTISIPFINLKIHTTQHHEIKYPVGENILTNLPRLENLIDETIEIIKKNEKMKTIHRINFIARGSSGAIIATLFTQAFRQIISGTSIKIIHINIL